MSFRSLVALAALTSACGTDVAPTALDDPDGLGASGLRRLTRFELTSSVGDAFGIAADDLASLLPEDQAGTSPFDNNYSSQTVSPLVIGAYAAFAQAYASRLAGDGGLAQRLAGCAPATADDAACFDQLARKVGRRMFRRPLTGAERDAYAHAILPATAASGSFATAVEMLGLLLVQHPAFLYRIEPAAGALDDFEVATRMAFLLTGSGPDDALLDDAEGHQLADRRGAHAERLLGTAQAKRNWQRFHALWLGFSDAPLPAALRDDLLAETEHLIDRVVFDQDAEWLALFRWPETFASPALAAQYGLAPVTAPGWIRARGGGVLTHGAFLTLGAKFGDTSPRVRGAEIFRRLTCGSLGTIPPTVDTDMPPGTPGDCKPQRYTMRDTVGCRECHGIIDNIGFGLEGFGVAGQWRTVEPGHPQCAIDGRGTWASQPFTGPAELGELIAADPSVSACATTQLFRFMTGRDEASDDARTLAAIDGAYRARPSLRRLLVELVEARAFTYRRGD